MKTQLKKLIAQLPEHVSRRDFFYLKKQLNKSHNDPKALDRLLQKTQTAQDQFTQRLTQQVTINLEKDLPVSKYADEIIKTIQASQVTIIAGETGSGKTTQIPKICLLAGLGETGGIACTQPRRIAAKSVAQRVADETKTTLGTTVGYQIRFDEKFDANGWIKFMTDGILLQQTLRDKWLNEYDVIIIDEAHERSLNIDFLLGFLKKLITKRKDLKVIITSATIDTEKFSKHFNNAPIINVEGRSYPVNVHYRPLDEKNIELNQGIIRAVDEIYGSSKRGDILVFLSGEREINDAMEALKHKHLPNTELLPLYARLTSAMQMKIFKPGDNRRIIFSTNVAETSLTVPRIHYVIDSGVARISRYSARSKIQGLQIEAIAQDSANQRMGRCGRIAEGHCFRLFSQTDFESRPEHSDPEILRTSLASVILQTHVLKLGHLSEFPFIDPPDYKMISDGYQLLFELQAIDEGNQLTQIGNKMAYLPIDVQLARIIIKANQYGCLREALIIVSALSSQDPRERPLEWSQAADKAHQKFADDESDFMALLLLWDYLNDNKNKKTNKEFRKMCRDQFISIKRFMEWRDVHRQLSGLVKNQKMQVTSQKSSYEMIHKALLAGFISHIGTIQTKHEYTGTRNKKFMIFPGSGLFNSQPKWLFAASIVHTSRVFGRTVAQVDAKWVEEVGKHLLKENYYDPFWSKKQGSVMGYKKTLILGLTLTDKQQFHYGPIDKTRSRQIFIEKALVEHQLNTRLGFYQHNVRMVAEIHAEEDRHRKKDLMIDQGKYYDLYDAKIPEGIYSESQLKKWISQHGDANLRFTEEDFYRRGAELPKEKLFPEELIIRKLTLKLNYQFQPGSEEDGVTVDLPLHWLNAVNVNDFEFLVPGLLSEKIQTLIKGLPKTIRRGLIPISEYAEILADKLDHSQEFYSQLVGHVMQINGLKTELEDWQKVGLPSHLKMRFRVLDKNHKVLVLNRDFQTIQNSFSQKANISFQKVASTNHKINGAKDWVFSKINQQVQLPSGLLAYSAIIDQGNCVGLQLYETERQASEIHVQGIVKLLQLKYPKILKQAKTCPVDIKAEFTWQTLETETRLIDELTIALIEKAIKKQSFISEQTSFDKLADQLKKQLYKQCYDWSHALAPVLIQWHKLWTLIEEKADLISAASIEDMNYQLDYLIYTDFLQHLEFADLQHYPRFLDGLAKRIETAIHSPEKEREKLQQLQAVSTEFYQLCEQTEIFTPAMQDYLILLEELRISLFAQQLGTKQKVSAKRLKTAFQQLL